MSDIRNLGVFTTVAALWAAHPEGGQEGDYAYIGASQAAGTKYRWNKYERIWENGATVTQTTGIRNHVVEGDQEVTGDLVVVGTLKAKHVKQPHMGMYASADALVAAIPNPEKGWYALVGNSLPAELYVCNTAGTWTDSGNEYDGESIDLTAYVLSSVFQDYTNRGYKIISDATPSTNPSSPSVGDAYLASTPGTYTNFGGVELADGQMAMFKYNGSSWGVSLFTVGKNYDGAIIPNFTPFPSPNLFNKAAVSSGKYVNKSTGALTSSSSWVASAYIDVSEMPVGTYIRVRKSVSYSGSIGVAAYDSNKVFTHGGTSMTLEEGDAYIRVSIPSTDLDTSMIYIGDAIASDVYYPYGVTCYKPKNVETINELLTKTAQLDTKIDDTASHLKRQLSGLNGIVKLTMSSGAFETAGSAYNVVYHPCTKGETFLCRTSGTKANPVGFSSAVPADGGTYTELASITADSGFVSVKAPNDGYIVSRSEVTGGRDFFLYTLRDMDLDTMIAHIVSDINEKNARAIDVDPDSENYGSEVYIDTTNCFASDYIDVEKYDYIAVPQLYSSSALYALSAGKFGAMFYDSNKEIVSVAGITFTRANASARSLSVYAVPSGAKYVRFSGNGDSYRFFIGYNRTQDAAQGSSVGDQYTRIIKGANQTIVYDRTVEPQMKLKAGVRYRMMIEQDLPDDFTTGSGMCIALYKVVATDGGGESSSRFYGIAKGASTVIPAYVDFTADEALYYYVGGRCPSGTRMTFRFFQAGTLGGSSPSEISDKTIFELNPDTEMLQKMVLANKKTNSGSSGSSTIPPLAFAHISDAHGASTQYARFMEFARHWKTRGYLQEIIDTGDVVADTYQSGIAWRDSIDGVKDVLTVIGNHDTRANAAEKADAGYPAGQNEWQYHGILSLDPSLRGDMYARYMVGPDSENPYVGNWGVTQPENAAVNGFCYYYKDYASRSLRMIALDVMGYDETQDLWLQARLAEAVVLGYHVFIISHYCGEVMSRLECNYTSLRSSGSSRSQLDGYNAYAYHIPISVDAFQDAGGVFVGYFTGHYHRDMVNLVTDYPKQLVFAVSSGGVVTIRDFTKVAGCKSYDDFQVVSINTYDKTVRLIKVGADTDYYMRKKGTLCVSYEIVTEDNVDKAEGVIGEGW